MPLEPRHVEQGLQSAKWPGRLERMRTATGAVWLDGAHNPHAAAALARALPGLANGKKIALVFGALQDKDALSMLRELGPRVSSVHYCAPDSPRSARPEELAKLWPGTVHASVREALTAAQGSAEAVVCAGSLYLVGEVRALLDGQAREKMPSERL